MKPAVLPDEAASQADAVRATVAANLDTLLEDNRWSRRAAALALGLSHRYVNSRATGEVEMSASDLVLFGEFLGVPIARFFETTKKAPTHEGGGQKLPEMDSNHQPAGSWLAPVTSLSLRRRQRSRFVAEHGATITAIRRAR